MSIKHLLRSLPIALLISVFAVPAQAGMVTTAQLLDSATVQESSQMNAQRDWIEAQLIKGGVPQVDATTRVAALTDAEITQIYQRIDEVPAAGASVLVLALVIFAVLEITGYIDVIPEQ